jgi:hypothetical protein
MSASPHLVSRPAPAPAGAGPAPTVGPTDTASFASLDLFDLGRRAAAARDARFGARASFVRSRQLLGTGAWRGPRDAPESYVEATDLPALGGWRAAVAAGARLLIGGADVDAHRAATPMVAADPATQGTRSLWRLPFRRGEPAADPRGRIEALRALVADGLPLWGVMPTPDGEPEGLDTLRLISTLRLDLPQIPHVVLDVAALGPRLAQMALGFGGDELWAPIVSERALRLGGNANNPSMTRKEAVVLIRGAGLAACERTGPDAFTEEPA